MNPKKPPLVIITAHNEMSGEGSTVTIDLDDIKKDSSFPKELGRALATLADRMLCPGNEFIEEVATAFCDQVQAIEPHEGDIFGVFAAALRRRFEVTDNLDHMPVLKRFLSRFLLKKIAQQPCGTGPATDGFAPPRPSPAGPRDFPEKT